MVWLRGVGYWLMQRLTLKLVRKWADLVYVTSVPEMRHFPNKKVVVIRGGVNIPDLNYEVMHIYDCVFLGRLHYQKGIKELLEIWKIVNKTIDGSVLLILGDGIFGKHIPKSKDIEWIKFVDDDEKDYYFRRSKIIVHPATYDSGGMACAEGMAYGLPAVGFDLPAYKTYYAKGMIKVKTIQEFADEIIKLLNNNKYYNYWSKEAKEYTQEVWDWNKRAEEIWQQSEF